MGNLLSLLDVVTLHSRKPGSIGNGLAGAHLWVMKPCGFWIF